MRLIDADALVAQMAEDAEYAEDVIAKMFIYGAISDVKHAPTIEQEPHWIPCSEERPEFPCLACDKFEQIFIPAGIVTVGKLYYDGLQFNGNVEEFLKGEKTGYGARVLPRKIVAWMPLPKPWKGADDE